MDGKAAFTRRGFLKLTLAAGEALALAPLMGACGARATPASTATATAAPTEDPAASLHGLAFDDFTQQSYRRWASRDPETLTVLGLANAYGVGDDSLTDISEEFIRETQALEAAMLVALRSYDRTVLSQSQALTRDIYEWFLDDLVRGHPFAYDDYPVNPVVTSVHYNLWMLFTVYHPLNSRKNAEDYIARLSQVGTKLDQLVAGLRRREERGVVLPGFLLAFVLQDVEQLGDTDPAAHPYLTGFSERLHGVTDEARSQLAARVQAQVRETVVPAYWRLAGCLENEQVKAPNQVGVWQFADGAAYYEQCLRRHTTTDMSADQIHELGLANVERIEGEMRSAFASLGYPADEPIPQLFDRLTAETGEYRGEEAVAAYEQALATALQLVPKVFEVLPRADVKVIGGLDGDYYTPASFDGTHPGLFFARTNAEAPRYGFKTTGFHEMVPGHHLQIALAQEIPGLPELRRGVQFNAFAEGWALYAERLMWELGAYDNDPAGNLGRLRMEAFRAARLVVDTGIHARRWGFRQAVDYLAQATGLGSAFAQTELARYSVWPGQAASYYIGYLKIMELRNKAMTALGSRFDLRRFHTAVLSGGCVPLPLLERQLAPA